MQGVEYPEAVNEPDLHEYYNWTPEEIEEDLIRLAEEERLRQIEEDYQAAVRAEQQA